jgi:hypothetical protein
MSDLDQFITRVEPPQIADLNDFVLSTEVPWQETPEGLLGFEPEVQQKLIELHEFSKTSTRKQTRNHAKKVAKQIKADKTKPKFAKVDREITVRFD